ncbi:LemA family protein [Nocardia sp. 2]|uniref:LemA family protein n=1 Tax=Nocardia acididurans TaxID=2802282 RepID=A0ABS1MHC9_9NOCA|nr:LemA family protein [Nocardia acididurans]MBL1080068.1 LemA family protein [Nocardia acididurans]
MAVALIVFVLLVGLALAAVLSSYNSFVRQRHTIEESWRQIDVELQRRHDLIPNLVETVRIAAGFEQQALLAVVNARTEAMRVRQLPGIGHSHRGHLESALSSAVHSVFGLAENYPQLRSNHNFLHLQRQLVETEDRIAAGRRFFNGNVRQYNTRLQTVPSSFVADMFSFIPVEYFELTDRQALQVPQIGAAWNRTGQPYPPQHDQSFPPPQSFPPLH